MLIRQHDDATNDEQRWRSFVANQGFGHLAASGTGRDVPIVVPTQFLLDGDLIVLHLARQNPILDALAENPSCVLSIAGDWAYIPGSWKAIGDEDPSQGIPTTYYGAVQLTGAAVVHDNPDDIANVLSCQLGDLEPDGGLVAPSEHPAQLRAIRAITITVSEVRAKFKYGGNADDAHRAQIAKNLAERNGPGDRAAGAHIG